MKTLINKHKKTIIFGDGGRMIPKAQSGWWKTGIQYNPNTTIDAYKNWIITKIKKGDLDLAKRIGYQGPFTTREISNYLSQHQPDLQRNYNQWVKNGQSSLPKQEQSWEDWAVSNGYTNKGWGIGWIDPNGKKVRFDQVQNAFNQRNISKASSKTNLAKSENQVGENSTNNHHIWDGERFSLTNSKGNRINFGYNPKTGHIFNLGFENGSYYYEGNPGKTNITDINSGYYKLLFDNGYRLADGKWTYPKRDAGVKYDNTVGNTENTGNTENAGNAGNVGNGNTGNGNVGNNGVVGDTSYLGIGYNEGLNLINEYNNLHRGQNGVFLEGDFSGNGWNQQMRDAWNNKGFTEWREQRLHPKQEIPVNYKTSNTRNLFGSNTRYDRKLIARNLNNRLLEGSVIGVGDNNDTGYNYDITYQGTDTNLFDALKERINGRDVKARDIKWLQKQQRKYVREQSSNGSKVGTYQNNGQTQNNVSENTKPDTTDGTSSIRNEALKKYTPTQNNFEFNIDNKHKLTFV